jgi:hypothetical protein
MRDGTPITRGEFIRLLAERMEDFNQRFDELMSEQAPATDTRFMQNLRVNGQMEYSEEPEGLEDCVQSRLRETRKRTVPALRETIFRTDGGAAR